MHPFSPEALTFSPPSVEPDKKRSKKFQERPVSFPDFNVAPTGTAFVVHSSDGNEFHVTAETGDGFYRYKVLENNQPITKRGSLAIIQAGKNKDHQPTLIIWTADGIRRSTGPVTRIEQRFEKSPSRSARP